MNMLIRWLRIILTALLNPKRPTTDTFVSNYRVGLHDLGWRDHLPNYRFLSFMELGACHYFFGTRISCSKSLDRRMISAQQVIYLKPVKPFQALQMRTSLLGWDHKYFFMRHDFYSGDKLLAIGLVKEACIGGGKVLTPAHLLKADGESHPVIESWLASHSQVKAMFP